MLEIDNLHAYYGDSHVLHGVSLRSRPGGIALLGRNGAGKTTLLKSIMGAGPRTSGVIRFGEQDIGNLPVHRRVQLGLTLVPEDRRIFPHMTLAGNLSIVRDVAPCPERAHDVAWAYRAFPMLEPLKDRLGNQLSGGQQQLLAVARALIGRPHFMLLDEPTEGLAPVIVEELAQRVSTVVQEEGAGLLLAEQNIWFARQCASHVYLIDAGAIVFEGDWREFDEQPAIRERYLGV